MKTRKKQVIFCEHISSVFLSKIKSFKHVIFLDTGCAAAAECQHPEMLSYLKSMHNIRFIYNFQK